MNTMLFRKALSFTALIILYVTAIAQVRWDGEGGDGQWNTASNWVGNLVPSSTDDVLLDNNIVPVNYVVTLPPGNVAVTVKSLTISPATGIRIEAVLPASNTLTGSPAFNTTGHGYGLLIGSGGIFRNASGATSGNTVVITDSLRINNGGKYSHNTLRAHASVVALLSKAPGTETGIFEFDVPGTASFIPSLPGRFYGTLVLSANAAGGTRTYSASGVQNVTVRGDLIIGSGVNCSISFGGTIIIKGNLVQQGGTFNIANNADNTTIAVEGNLIQNAGSITETGTALPVIQLNGAAPQQVWSDGSFINSITLKINNAAGVTLQTPLSLPYKLELINGKLNTNSTNLLNLKAGCTIVADSLSGNSFINGPLRKEGLSATAHFLFPIGKDAAMRWLALHNATGNFTVEFMKGSPQAIATQYTTGIDHISGLEYWAIDADAAPTPSAQLELSFIDPNSGGITNMSSLRVALFTGINWQDGGNITYTGTPGFRGSVISNLLNPFPLSTRYLSLASSDASNPLPSKWVQFNVHMQKDRALLNWTIAPNTSARYFDILVSTDNRTYTPAGKMDAGKGIEKYLFTHQPAITGSRYYRIVMTEEDGTQTYSTIIPALFKPTGMQLISMYPSVVTSGCNIRIQANEECCKKILIINSLGQLMKTITYTVQPGITILPVETAGLPAGIYTICIDDKTQRSATLRFMKL